jgi:predicted RNA-binding protein
MVSLEQSYWLFSVTPENWKIMRSNKIWAVRTKNIAEKVKRGDYVVLYVAHTKAFCSVIQIAGDWIQSVKPYWVDEIEENKVMYPFKANVNLIQEGLARISEMVPKVSFVTNKKNWGVYVQGTPANCRRPLPERDYQIIVDAMKSNPLPTDISSIFVEAPKKVEKRPAQKEVKRQTSEPPKHNEIRDMIVEIGNLEGKIAEEEYPLDNLRLDAVWKTIQSGIPKWAFEVQLGGNFYEALTKLKHAWDKWNSKPVLVTTDYYVTQAKSLLEGSFHEMRDDARIVNWEKIVRLHRLLKEAHAIRSEVRL